MKITESKLRRIIRSVIKEAMEPDMGRGYSPSGDDYWDDKGNYILDLDDDSDRDFKYDTPPLDRKKRGEWARWKNDINDYLNQVPGEGNKAFFNSYHSHDAKIHRMHDLYKLDKNEKRIVGNDKESTIAWHVNKQLKRPGMFGANKDAEGFVAEYNARVYYDKSLDDNKKISLMIRSDNKSANTQKINDIDCEGQSNKYQLSDDKKGITVVLCEPESRSKTIIELRFDKNPGAVERFAEFLDSKDFKKVYKDEDI